MFTFPWKSTSGTSLPDWLATPGPVLLRRHVRHHKTDPLVETVLLQHANPQYAFVAFRDGREDTVSVRDLAPAGVPDVQVSLSHLLPVFSPLPPVLLVISLQPQRAAHL